MSGLMNALGIIVAIFGMGLIIYVHELGHFVSGKLLKIKVTEFFIGMPIGRPLVRFKRGETEYGIKPALVGGYVKFPEYISLGDTEIEKIRPGGPAEAAGLRQNDNILSIDGNNVDNWRQIYDIVSNSDKNTVDIEISRNNERSFVTAVLENDNGRRLLGAGPMANDDITIDDLPETLDGQGLIKKSLVSAAGPFMNIALAFFLFAVAFTIGFAEPTNIIGEVMPHSPASRVGLKAGDKVISIAGEKTPEWTQVTEAIAKNSGESVMIVVERDSNRRSFRATLRNESDDGLLGIATKLERRPYTPPEAVVESGRLVVNISSSIVGVLARLVVAPGSVIGQLRGPIGVVQATAPIAQRDLLEYAATLAALSIAIGIFNLIPIPPLDGGRIVISGVELLTRHRLRKESLLVANAVGVSILLVIMVYVIVADIFRLSILQ